MAAADASTHTTSLVPRPTPAPPTHPRVVADPPLPAPFRPVLPVLFGLQRTLPRVASTSSISAASST